MNLVADECVDHPIVDALRVAGHVVDAVAEMSSGVTDEEVLELARARGAVVMTMDTDFGELVYRLGQASQGVLLLRLSGLSADRKAELVSRTIAEHGEKLPGAFSVLSASQLRVRRMGA